MTKKYGIIVWLIIFDLDFIIFYEAVTIEHFKRNYMNIYTVDIDYFYSLFAL